MKELKYFNQLSEYTADKDNFTYPTVSYVEENKEVYYKEKPEVRIVTYTTTGASQEVKLVNKQEYLDYCKILDTGEELTVTGTGALNYTFTDTGEHQVELKFKDDATTLSHCFSGCTALTSIPENLFKYNTEVTNFRSTFYNCSGLTNIPENLFSSNTAVTNFSSTFYNCDALTSIPTNLFNNCTAVNSFYNTFLYCSGLTGNVPVDNDSTPIYNRSGDGKPGYAIVTSYADCFGHCTGLTDYSSIPTDWK